jgi:serine/threonine protein kinase/tetratricopeptide (TPR) repeat protein
MRDLTLIDSRYQVLRTIGSGGMGVVYLAVDTRRGNQIVALKLATAASKEESSGFQSEFRNIRGVIHPHIPQVFDFGTPSDSSNTHYFTCEFVDGKPLDSLTDNWTPDQLRFALVALCRALAFLHSRNLLHRDIKPENVLAKLDPFGNFSILKLVDFGLSAENAQAEAGEPVGTLDYMAPELLRDNKSSVATDLYALGMLLYRVATGKLPFDGENAASVAQVRAQFEAPHPLRFKQELPVGFADVIAALIRIRPEERPPSARHVIAMLNERDGCDFDYETPDTRKAYISSSASITHPDVRDWLTQQKLALLSGHSPLDAVVNGRPGLGRTRLLKEFASELTMSGLQVRMIAGLSDLPNPNRLPQVVLIPDAHQFNQADFQYLREKIPGKRWWIVAGDFAHGLPEWLNTFHPIPLQPLDHEGIHNFISVTFPDNRFPNDLDQKLLGVTLGYPSALESALEQLLQSGQLRIGLQGWEILPGRWNLPLQHHTQLAIEDSIAALSPCAKKALQTLCCSQTPVPEKLLSSIPSEQSCNPLQSTRDELLIAKWITESAGRYSVTFDAVREVVLESLDDEEKRKIHAVLYRLWKNESDVKEQLREQESVYHDCLAGLFETTPKELNRVISQAVRQGKHAWARKLIEPSLDFAPPNHREQLLILLSQIEYSEGDFAVSANLLGEIVANGRAEITPENIGYVARYAALQEKLGATDVAEEILSRCYGKLAPDRDDAAGSVYGTLAWIAFKRGDAERARKLAEEGLIRIAPHSADPGYALFLNTVATLAFYRGDNDVARVYWQRCLEVNEAIGDRKGIANMFNNLGVLAAQSGDRLRARALWEKCAEIAKEIDDVHRLAGIYNNLGIDSLETGELRNAEEYYLKAISLFRRLKSPREEAEILSNLGELAFHRADYTRSMAFLQASAKLAAQHGDQEGQIEPLVYLGKLLLTLEQIENADAILTGAQELASAVGSRKGEGQAWEGIAMIRARKGDFTSADQAVAHARMLLSDDVDPLALLHLHLTRCQIAADEDKSDLVVEALHDARTVADTKWDPYTAARTQLAAVLFAGESLDPAAWTMTLRKLSVYPDFLWKFHWATARKLAAIGQLKKSLEEFGRGIAVLKSISSRLPDQQRDVYLNAPQITRFKNEAVQLRQSLQAER